MSHSVPTKISLDNLLGVIQGWYAAGAHEEPCTNSDVAERIGTTSTTVSRQNQFLLSMSFLERNGNSKKLTEKGSECAESLRLDRDDSKEKLRELLYQYPPTDAIVDFVSIQNPDRNAIIEQLNEITEHGPDSDASIETLLELYQESGIVFEEDDGFNAISKKESDPAQDREQEENRVSGPEEDKNLVSVEADNLHSSGDSESNVSTQVESQTSNAHYTVNIELSLDGDDDPEKVFKIVSAVKNGLENSTGEIERAPTDSEIDQIGLSEFE